jgi:hypothetical protein
MSSSLGMADRVRNQVAAQCTVRICLTSATLESSMASPITHCRLATRGLDIFWGMLSVRS